MEDGSNKWLLTTLSGALVVLLYCTFTFVSWAYYPAAYGPSTHYLSRLGNYNFNTLGAFFYNIGCILTGIALVPFFISLRIWYTNKTPQMIILGLGQVVGLLSAIALMLIGIFSEDQGEPHLTASSTFFLLNFSVLILVNLALVLHPRFIKLIALYGFAIDFTSLYLESTIGGPIVEWFTVFGALLFVALLSVNAFLFYRRQKGDNI